MGNLPKMSKELEALPAAKQAQIPLQQHLQSIPKPSNDNDKKWQTLRNNKVKMQQILELQRFGKINQNLILPAYINILKT